MGRESRLKPRLAVAPQPQQVQLPPPHWAVTINLKFQRVEQTLQGPSVQIVQQNEVLQEHQDVVVAFQAALDKVRLLTALLPTGQLVGAVAQPPGTGGGEA